MIKVGHTLSDQEIARRYSASAGQLSLPPYFYPAVARFGAIDSSGVILDAGCGNGDLLVELAARPSPARLVGVEISTGRLRVAQQRLQGQACLMTIGADGRLPFADNTIDTIVTTEVIEHLKDPQRFLRELRRVLAPDGRLVLTSPNSDAYPMWERIAPYIEAGTAPGFARYFLPWEHPLRTRQPIDTVLAIDEVAAILRQVGFAPVRIHGREALPYLFSFHLLDRLWQRKLLPRFLIDALFNRLGWQKFCYRTFWECRKS